MARQYYLDPNDPDTNGDGALDGSECVYDEDNNTLTCGDTDGNNIPDSHDDDNDGDGVPDADDSAPSTYVGDLTNGVSNGEFNFAIDDLTSGKAAYVDFQLRPTDADHLWYTLNVLDWPSDDHEGQIQRFYDQTLYEATPVENRPMADPRSKNGDMRLIPMLEIEMPYQAGHSRNLPTIAGAPTITASTPITAWLDTAEMQSFGVSVRKAENGDLFGYVPLILTRAKEGGGPTAFTGRMLYRPNSTWGDLQTARLVWMVEVLTDSCSEPPKNTPRDVHCANEANWTSNGTQIVHKYDDDFIVTGLSVREDNGASAAVIYQNPSWTTSQAAYSASGFNEDVLWGAAQALEQSLLSGQNNGTNRTVTVPTLSAATFTGWGLPSGSLSVAQYNFDHQSLQATLAMTHTKQLLDTHFTSYATANGLDNTNFLFAREERYRSATNDLDDIVTPVGGNGLRLSLDTHNNREFVSATVNWSPYRYNSMTAAWESYPIDEYWAELDSKFDETLVNYWQDDEIRDGVNVFGRSYYMGFFHGQHSLIEYDNTPTRSDFLPSAEISSFIGYDQSFQFGWAIDNVIQHFDALSTVLDVQAGALSRRFEIWALKDTKFGDADLLSNPKSGVTNRDALKTRLKIVKNGGRGQRIASALNSDAGDLQPANKGAINKLFKNIKTPTQAAFAVATVNSVINMSLAAFSVGLAIASNFIDVSRDVTIVITALQASSALIELVTSTIVVVRLFALQLAAKGATLGKAFASIFKQGLTTVGGSVTFAAIVTAVVSIGLFVVQIVASGIEVSSLAFTAALSGLIASLIVAVILIAIGAIPVIGQLIAGLIALIDLVVSLICQLTGANSGAAGTFVRDWICPGISGLMTKAVQWLIFDQNPMVDLQHTNRFNFNHWDIQLTDPAKGYALGNTSRVAFDVEVALYRPDWEFSAVSAAWSGQFLNDEYLQWARFNYGLSSSEKSHAATLTLGGGANPWRAPLATDWADDANAVINAPQRVTATVPFVDSGINSKPALYLNEEYVIPVQECWGLTFASGCAVRFQDDTLNIDIGRSLKYDVFPHNISDFYELVTYGDEGGYRLAWGDRFPLLMDADGDGLRSAAVGGNDPDDSNPDVDGDTLSDFFEIENGTDPLLADTDGEGLTDDQELRYGTDPLKADSDFDGLEDDMEITGWAFVYDLDASGNPLTTWVWSDPLNPNADFDEYLDGDEFSYGFNPNIPTSGLLLDLNVEQSAAYIPANGSFNFTTTITNGLRSRYALGLLDTVVPSALSTGDVTTANFALSPNRMFEQHVTLSSNVASSQAAHIDTSVGAVARPLNPELAGRTLWLKFDETSSATTFTDYSLNENHGTCVASGITCPDRVWDSGRIARHFTDATDEVRVPGSAEDYGFTNGSFTVLSWFKTDDRAVGNNTFSPLIAIGGDELRIGVDNRKPFFVYDNWPNWKWVVADNELAENSWYRLAWRYDAATQAHTIFADGKQIATTVTPGLVVDHSTLVGDDVRIGTEWFRNQVDDLEIFPLALDNDYLANEVGEQVFYYRFDRQSLYFQPHSADDSGHDNTVSCATDSNEDYFCPIDALYTSGKIDGAHNFLNASQVDALMYADAGNDVGGFFDFDDGLYTLAVWAKQTKNDEGFVIGHINPPGQSASEFPYLKLAHLSNGAITVRAGFDQVGAGARCESFVSPAGDGADWHHYAVTFDRTTLRVYMDGVEIGSVNCSGSRPPYVGGFYIGDYENQLGSTNSTSYVGELDELRLFNYALSAETIAELANATSAQIALMGSAEISFDEAPGQVVITDHSNSGLNATCANCPTTGVQGLFGQAAQFANDPNQYLQLGTSNQLGIPDGFTVSAWVRTNGDINGYRNILHMPDGDLQLRLFYNKVQLYMGEVNGDPVLSYNDVPLSHNVWHHVVWRYTQEGQFNTGTREIFIDGSLVTSDTFNRISDITSQQWPLLGNKTVYVGSQFPGLIDELTIFNEPISNARVWQLYNAAPGVNLQFDEPIGSTTFADAGRFGSDGTHNATCSGNSCPQAGTAGRVYNAVTFDGIDDKLEITYRYIDLLDFNQFSVGMWVKPTQIQGSWTPLLTKEQYNASAYLDRTFGLFLAPNSTELFYSMRGCNGGTHADHFTGTSLQLNAWNHIMLTYDGNQGSDNIVAYLNGAPVHISTATGERCNAAGDPPVRVGNWHATPQFAGQVDELVLDSSTWSPERIARMVSHQSGWMNANVRSTVVIDADNPTVELDVDAEYLPEEVQILAVKASDPTSQVERVYYSINHGANYEAVRDGDAWLLTFDPAYAGSHVAPEHAYYISIVAVDSVGNSAGTGVNQKFDSVGIPIAAHDLVNPRPIRDSAADNWYVELSGYFPNGIDDGSTIESVRVDLIENWNAEMMMTTNRSLNGWHDATIRLIWVDTFNWKVQYPIDVLTSGTYTVVAEARDEVGNVTTVRHNIVIDGTAPQAQIASVFTNTALMTGTHVISGSIVDSISAVASVEVGYEPTDLLVQDEPPILSLSFDQQRFNNGDVLADASPITHTKRAWVAFQSSPNESFDALPGIVGSAAMPFNGSNLLVDIDANADFDLSGGAYTQAAWVYPTFPSNASGYIFGNDYYRGLGNHYPSIAVIDKTKLVIGFGDGTAYDAFTTGDVLTENAWNFVVVTFDGSMHKVYIDGQLVESSTQLADKTPAVNDILLIGATSPTWSAPVQSYFNGALDQVEMYAVALSAETIQQHYLRRWQPATLNSTRSGSTWQTTIPSNLHGSYQLRLRTTDSLGNVSFGSGDNANWNGYITPDAVPTAATLSTAQTDRIGGAPLPFMVSLLLTIVSVVFFVLRKLAKRAVFRDAD